MIVLPIYSTTFENVCYVQSFKLTIHLGCIYIVGKRHLALWMKSIDNQEALKILLHDYPNTNRIRGTNDNSTNLYI